MAVDRNSATAMHLRGVIEDLIDGKMRSICRPGNDWDKTQVLRGELVAYRRLYKEVSLIPIDDEEENESD